MNLCLRNSVSFGVEDGVNESIISHDWGWVEDGAREELGVWADVLAVGEGGVVAGLEVVEATNSTVSVAISESEAARTETVSLRRPLEIGQSWFVI